MEIAGIGLDILEIDRMLSKVTNRAFMRKIFLSNEIEYIVSKKNTAPATAAGLFCAKEAFMKAVGEGMTIPFLDLEVGRDHRGKPHFVLHGKTAEAYSNYSFQLSITHSKGNAAAVVIAVK